MDRDEALALVDSSVGMALRDEVAERARQRLRAHLSALHAEVDAQTILAKHYEESCNILRDRLKQAEVEAGRLRRDGEEMVADWRKRGDDCLDCTDEGTASREVFLICADELDAHIGRKEGEDG